VLVRNKKIKLSGILVFSIFFSFGLCEFILYPSKFPFTLNEPQKNIYNKPIYEDKVYDPKNAYLKDGDNIEYGYSLKNSAKIGNIASQKKYKKIYSSHTSFFSNGFRYTECNQDSNDIYVFLGCSFTFGDGLNDNQTLPYYFSKSMGFKSNVLNFGMPSRGSTTALNILNNNVINNFIEEKKVKHFIYNLISGHLDRNFNVLKFGSNDNWIFENNKWERLKQPFGNIKIIFARSYIFNKIFLPIIEEHNKSFYEKHLLEDLKKIDRIIREKYNSKLIIIVWSDIFKHKKLAEGLKELGVDMIMLPDYFYTEAYKIAGDGHPNAKANEEIANILMEHLKDKI
jgi:hypothetical protein